MSSIFTAKPFFLIDRKIGPYWYLWAISEVFHSLRSELEKWKCSYCLCFFFHCGELFRQANVNGGLLFSLPKRKLTNNKNYSKLEPRLFKSWPRLAQDFSSRGQDLPQDMIRLKTWLKTCQVQKATDPRLTISLDQYWIGLDFLPGLINASQFCFKKAPFRQYFFSNYNINWF